jgi:hypothetical protein
MSTDTVTFSVMENSSRATHIHDTSTKGHAVKNIPKISLPGEVGGLVGTQNISLEGTTLIVFFDSTESEF